MKGWTRPRSAADVIATLGGLGDASLAPGTWGSLLAVAALFPLRETRVPYGAILLALAAAAIWSSGIVARRMKSTDPARVVIDEAVGMGLVLLAPLPAGWGGPVLAFLLFRLFDILKPPPLRRLERLPGGWGIVLDDVGAAAYAMATLAILHSR